MTTETIPNIGILPHDKELGYLTVTRLFDWGDGQTDFTYSWDGPDLCAISAELLKQAKIIIQDGNIITIGWYRIRLIGYVPYGVEDGEPRTYVGVRDREMERAG